MEHLANDDNAASESAEALRVLLREAVRRGFTVTSLANALNGGDRKTLAGYIRSAKPSSEIIERIARTLGYPPIVARALLGELDDRDVRGIRGGPIADRRRPAPLAQGERRGTWSIEVALSERQEMIDDFATQYELFDKAWPALSPERRRAAAAAFVLACEGLALEPRSPLAALEHELAKDGHVLDIAERVNTREAAIAFVWLAEAASLSVIDQEDIWKRLRQRLGAEHPIEIEPQAERIISTLRNYMHQETGRKS